MNIPIVYEDNDILVLNKPSELITHPKNISDTQSSVTGWLIKNYPEIENVGEAFVASGKEVPRAGVVHRLDKDTSGLLIIAKNNEAFFYFKNLFQEKKIKKYYLALVGGRPKKPKDTISAPLGRIGLKRTAQITGKKLIDKKEALTEYKTVKNFQKYTLLEVAPQTGRTHQIRVHLNFIGHSVAGDPIYGFKRSSPPPGLKRLFLHAYKLSFVAPDGKSLTLETELPEDLQNVLSKLQ